MEKKQMLVLAVVAMFFLIVAHRGYAESTSRMYTKGVLKDNPQVTIEQFSEDGLSRCENPASRDEKVSGIVLFYDQQGNLLNETTYVDGLANGEYKQYDTDTNTVEWIIPYKNGKENGVKRSYKPDGTKSLEIPLVDGILHGVRRTHYKNGQVKKEKTYKNGKQDGLVKSYYKNGNVKYEGERKDGKKFGLQQWYYKNGNLKTIGHYTNDEKDGHFKWYNEDGSLKTEATY